MGASNKKTRGPILVSVWYDEECSLVGSKWGPAVYGNLHVKLEKKSMALSRASTCSTDMLDPNPKTLNPCQSVMVKQSLLPNVTVAAEAI